jgi:hypothetical protein
VSFVLDEGGAIAYDAPMRRRKTSGRGRGQRRLAFERPQERKVKLGRKKSASSGPSHQAREEFDPRHPLHVTVKLVEGLPSLRWGREYGVIVEALRAGCTRAGRLVEGVFRLVHFSVQGNHMHWIVEAGDRESLARGVGGMCIRIAKALNRLWKRTGEVFAQRYHAHVLGTPSEVRNALAYLYRNAEKHGRKAPPGWMDPCTSARWFDEFNVCPALTRETRPVASALTWLLKEGLRRAGRLWPAPPHATRG